MSLWSASAQALRDNFTDREILTAVSGSLNANNSAATLEVGEPQHGGKIGGHSLWISWIAPTNGIVQFATEGSSFDTLLSVYAFSSTNDTTLSQLIELARADDSEGFGFESEVKFGVLAGQRYEIAADGYFGASGPLELHWSFVPTPLPPPIILRTPADRAVALGTQVSLVVTVTNSANGRYQWFHNEDELDDQNALTLVISSIQATNVGRYRLRVEIDGANYYSIPIELQVNSDGSANTFAQDKVPDALSTALSASGGGGAGGFLPANAGVSRGYNGTQIFNTIYSTPDPAEPAHCGTTGSSTYWYAYQPPANGTLTLDTIGSAYDTLLAVYTYDPPYTGYADLIPIVCDDNGAGTNGAARLEFAAPKSRQFLIVIEGLNGGRGLAYLNYRLDTNRPPVPPTLIEAPVLRTAASGSTVTLQPMIQGSLPLRFLWSKGSNILAGATNNAFIVTNATPDQSGDYRLTVSSHVGVPLNVVLPLRVVVPPQLQFLAQPDGTVALSYSSVAGQRYLLEQTDALGSTWQTVTNVYSGDGFWILPPDETKVGNRFYRISTE